MKIYIVKEETEKWLVWDGQNLSVTEDILEACEKSRVVPSKAYRRGLYFYCPKKREIIGPAIYPVHHPFFVYLAKACEDSEEWEKFHTLPMGDSSHRAATVLSKVLVGDIEPEELLRELRYLRVDKLDLLEFLERFRPELLTAEVKAAILSELLLEESLLNFKAKGKWEEERKNPTLPNAEPSGHLLPPTVEKTI